MKKVMIGLALVLLAMPAAARHEVRTIEREFPITPDQTLQIEIPVGEVTLHGSGGDQVVVKVEIECRRSSRSCQRRAERIELESRSGRRSLDVWLDRYPRGGSNPEVEVRITVPRSQVVELEMGIGALEIAGMEGDLEVDLGIGEANIDVAESKVRSVDLTVGIGEADLRPHKASSDRSGFLFLGNEVEWDDGPGRAEIHVDVGIGEIDVVLE